MKSLLVLPILLLAILLSPALPFTPRLSPAPALVRQSVGGLPSSSCSSISSLNSGLGLFHHHHWSSNAGYGYEYEYGYRYGYEWKPSCNLIPKSSSMSSSRSSSMLSLCKSDGKSDSSIVSERLPEVDDFSPSRTLTLLVGQSLFIPLSYGLAYLLKLGPLPPPFTPPAMKLGLLWTFPLGAFVLLTSSLESAFPQLKEVARGERGLGVRLGASLRVSRQQMGKTKPHPSPSSQPPSPRSSPSSAQSSASSPPLWSG